VAHLMQASKRPVSVVGCMLCFLPAIAHSAGTHRAELRDDRCRADQQTAANCVPQQHERAGQATGSLCLARSPGHQPRPCHRAQCPRPARTPAAITGREV
jgi:hypothetical protein